MSDHTLFTNEHINATTLGLVAGEIKDALVSEVIPNGGGGSLNSARLTIDYSSLLPAAGGNYFIGCELEAKQASGLWAPIAYQFEPVRGTSQAMQRIIIVQPDLSVFDAGIDDIVAPTGDEQSRISRQQGEVPDSDLRVRFLIKDNLVGQASAFECVDVSAELHLYSV